MKAEDKSNQLDQLIRKAIGRDSVPFDFQQWKQQHQSSIEKAESLRRESSPPLMQAICEYVAVHRRSVIRLAGLAAIVLFALVSVNPFSGPKGGIAFGRVLENMVKVQSFHATVDYGGKESEIWAKRPNMLRIENDGDIIEISNGPTMWAVNIPFNKATKKSSPYYSIAQKQGLDVIDYFIQRQCDPFEGFFSESPVDHITLDGRRIDVYRTRFRDHGTDASFEALVDGETHLIHSLTLERHRDGELTGQFSLSGIEYNGPVADDLFSFQPPEKMRVIIEEPKEPPVSESAAQGATLSGLVTWAGNGKPVAGARLTLSGGRRTVTDSKGRQKPEFFEHVEANRAGYWQISGAPAGRVAISVRGEFDWPAMPLFTTNTGSLDRPAIIVDGQSEYTGLNFRVYKPNDYYARITVDVTDEDGRPVRGASAYLQDTEGGTSQHVDAIPGRQQFSQEDGKFDARNIWPTIRPVRLHVGPRDQNEPYVLRGVYAESFMVEPQKSYHFDVVLPYKRAMTVRAVDPNGRPLEGVAISVLEAETASIIYPLSGPRGQPLLTDSNGQADVSGMSPGEKILITLRRLDLNKPDQWNPLVSALARATVSSDRSKPIVEAVFDERPIAVDGRLHLDSAVQSVFVLVYVTGQPGDLSHMPVARAAGDDEGRFTLRGLPAGTIRLLYSAVGPGNTSRRGEGIMGVERGNRYHVEFTEQGLQVLSREPMP